MEKINPLNTRYGIRFPPKSSGGVKLTMKEIIELKEKVNTISEAKELFKQIKRINIDYSQENVLIIYLSSPLEIIDIEVLFKGGLNSCIIDPKTLFRKALLKNSCAVIIAHNHPSGDLTPSQGDIENFEDLEEAGGIIKIKVLDSIIFNEKEFYSIDDHR
jgi:DNA repair protein RadC